MPNCLKPFRSFSDQLEILKKRGLVVVDDQKAQQCLENLNYYRLSGFTYMRMDRSKNRFRAAVTFDQIVGLYDFDEKLRHILSPLIESIELALRCRLAYCFSEAHHDSEKYPNNDAHYHVCNYCDLQSHETFFEKILPQHIENHKSDLFVAKHIKCYDGKMPLWALVEILSFTNLSKLYGILLTAEQDAVAKCFNSVRFYMENWINVMVVLRNKCAHYGRLYGTQIAPPISLPNNFKTSNPMVKNNTLFAVLYIALLMAPPTFPKKDFISQLEDLIGSYASIINLEELSFPKNWKTILSNIKLPNAKK